MTDGSTATGRRPGATDVSAQIEPRWAELLERLIRGEDLEAADTESVLTAVMSGEASAARLAGFLVALRAKGTTATEMTGLARTMRRFAVPLEVPGPVVDTCGTGGDRAGTFNISTLSAIVAAAAGATVVKHGNRAASGQCGSADLLEHWGVVIDLDPDGVAACVDELGIGFCFARTFHPAMRHVASVRADLGVPTVFNHLGPLTNPAGAQHQTIGVVDSRIAQIMAETLALLGTTHALVFHGRDGLDELTTTGPSEVWQVRDGQVTRSTFDPASHGVPAARPEDLRGGDVATNAAIAERVLAGEPGPARDVVVLGAAAALVAGDVASSWSDALHRAEQAIASGAALRLRDAWVATSRRLGAAAPRG